MKKRYVMLSLFTVCFLLMSTLSYADANKAAISSMSNIMLHLNHYPSDSEKKQLNKFISDKSLSGNVRTMAQAMTALEHKATDGDKKKLSAIIDDKSASADEKTLAMVIRDLDHKPSDADKQKLQEIAK